MIVTNSHFMNRLRSAYELSKLLRDLPITRDVPDADTRLQLEAADRHADNYGEILLDGLESLGHVMFSAANNEAWPVEQHDMAALGEMISQMSVQLQFISEFRDSVRNRIEDANKKGGRK
jgi:hypothetical protein